MTTTRRSVLWLAASGLTVLVAAWLTRPIVPLYDGVGFPDEPYRYVNRPSATLPASSAIQTIPLSGLDNSVFAVVSQESGPQFTLHVPPQALSAPKPAIEVVIRADPKAPTTQPASGTIAGNVYVVTATSQPGPPTIDNGQVSISLRLPQGTPSAQTPVMEFRQPGGNWKPLITEQVGTDVYEAHFNGVGEYSMVTGAGEPAASSKRQVPLGGIIAGIVLLGLVVATVVAIRLAGRRRSHEDPR